MGRLKVFTNLANRIKKVVGKKEGSTHITPEEIRDVSSYVKMESVLHTERKKGTVRPQKSDLIDDIGKIRTAFQLYNGAKNRIRLHDGGIKDKDSGYLGDEKKTMKNEALKITAQLEDKGWKKYFEMPYQQALAAIDEDKSMPQKVSNNLKELCKEYGSDFKNFKNELQSETFKVPEENNSITAPTF
ncbi:hypothetical protein [Legionella tucsonensis]|uniref:Uncharacterized protein n=1 Tax=Legionella tucsonensis TaxID=40335 RepID=A0A0W0ZW26_9GAMM|nr:hypothetical protein [Legionella tucsonensis]KTD72979.1 hypothetical protein Ltuc_0826 [Legionella tucsonensis]